VWGHFVTKTIVSVLLRNVVSQGKLQLTCPLGQVKLLDLSQQRSLAMSYALSSFAPSFFFGNRGTVLRTAHKPTSLLQAIVSLSPSDWDRVAIFHVKPVHLTVESLLDRIVMTNCCCNLDSPIEVWIDHDGFESLLVYDEEAKS
jgi:hypothetical protein